MASAIRYQSDLYEKIQRAANPKLRDIFYLIDILEKRQVYAQRYLDTVSDIDKANIEEIIERVNDEIKKILSL